MRRSSSLVTRVASSSYGRIARRMYQFDSPGGGGGGGFNFGSFSGNQTSASTWPRSMWNTVICICPPGEKLVVERIDGVVQVREPGVHPLIPIVHKIAYRVDMREMAIEIPPQTTITKDNVSVDVSGCIYVQVRRGACAVMSRPHFLLLVLFLTSLIRSVPCFAPHVPVQFNDAEKAAYGNTNPLYAITQFAQSSMRSEIGKMELDLILHARDQLNTNIMNTVTAGAEPWGLSVLRYEITEVRPDQKIREAMDKQAAAERTRRELVKGAEGTKQEMVLQSEGVKSRLINESEGEMIKVQNEAKALASKLELEAEGEARAVKLKSEAQAEAIKVMAAAIAQKGGMEAAQLDVAKEYVSMYGQMGSTSNTMLFQDKPADINALMAQAATVLKNVHGGDGGADSKK